MGLLDFLAFPYWTEHLHTSVPAVADFSSLLDQPELTFPATVASSEDGLD